MFVRWKHKTFTRVICGLILCFFLAWALFFTSAAGALSTFDGTFTEGFESNSLATNSWISTGGASSNWLVTAQFPFAGTYSVQAENVDAESTLSTTISTLGYNNITFSFWYDTDALDPEEYLRVDWYNGTGWTNVLNVTDVNTDLYTLSNTSLPSSANNNSNFAIRFRCNNGANNEICSIDNITVSGVLIPDTTFPQVQFVSPTTASGNYSQDYITANVTATDNNLSNINIYLYNSTGLVNSTIGSTSPLFLNFTNLPDGTYYLNATANDTSGNTNSTETRTIVLDTTEPQIQFVSPTTATGNYSQNYITANVTANDTNLDTITINLYNSTGLVNSTISSTGPLFINFTNLSDGTYYLNATANDTIGNTNSTETRTIVLDTTEPQIQFVSPTTASGRYTQDIIEVNVTANDANLDTITINLYNLTSLVNSTSSSGSPLSLNFTNLPYTTYYLNATVNDTSGNTNSTETRTIHLSPINLTLISYYGLNSSLGMVGDFNTTNLEEIEYMVLNFNLDSDNPIDQWYLNFTANGTNGCSLGNQQNNICYNYNSSTYKWIQFVNGTNTTTFDGITSNQGDRIEVTKTGSGNSINLSFRIDEHYNPNVFKWYNARYNFSDVKWQNGTEQRITGSNLIKVELNQSLIPLDADQYKLDIRVGHVGDPTQKLFAFFCNSSYVPGTNTSDPRCILVGLKNASQLQNDGTKFRAIFTKNLIYRLGDVKYVILASDGINSSDYYYIKTYKATAPAYTTHWEYTNNFGNVWNNLADGYETELNINWFYDGAEPTAFVYKFWGNTTTGEADSVEGNVTWNIDPTINLFPISTIIFPRDGEIISTPKTISLAITDPNNDTLNANLSLYQGGVFNKSLATNMDSFNTSFYWNDSTPDGNYSLLLETCETNTTELYCVNHSVAIMVDNTKPQIQFVSPTLENGIYSQDYISVNVTASDIYLENITINLYNSIGLVNSTNASTGPLFINFTNLSNRAYYINATAIDTAGNTNSTETRTIVLDNLSPNITLISPANTTYNTTDNLPLNYSADEANPDTCFYSLNGGANITIAGCQNTTFSSAIGTNSLIIYINDTSGNLDSDSVVFTAYANTSLDVFDSADPVQTLENFYLYANYTYTSNSSPIQNATCVINGTFGIFDDGRMATFNEVSGQDPNETGGVYGNRTRRYDFNNTLLGGITYHPIIKYHKLGNPADNLYVYVRCDGNHTLDSAYIIGNETPEETLAEPAWAFSIIDFDNISSENCSVFVASPGSTDYNNSYHILRSNIAENGTYLSNDSGQTWTPEPYLDVVDFGHTWSGTTMSYNESLGAYQSDYIMHLDVIGNSSFNVTCNKTNHITRSETEFVTVEDYSNPITQISSIVPNPAEYLTDNVTILWAARDLNLETKKINISYPNGTLLAESADSPFDINASQLSEIGNYTILVWANDTSGYNSTSTANLTVQDALPPSVYGAIPAEGQTFNSTTTIEIAVNVTDLNSISSVFANVTFPNNTVQTLTLNNSEGAKYNISFTIPNGALDGVFNITFIATDIYGNVNSTTKTNFTSVDAISPLVQFVSPTTAAGNYSQNYIVANVTATDGHLDTIVIYLYNSTGLVNSTSNSSSPLFINFTNIPDGTYYLNATANDTFGNLNSTETRTILLDTTAPSLEIVSPENTTYTNSSVLINISSNGDNVWYNYNGTNYTYTTAINVSFSDGNYVLHVWANDTFGNLNYTNVSFEVNVFPPQIQFVSPTTATGNYSQSYIVVNVTVPDTDLDTITIYLYNSTGLVNSTSDLSSPLYINFTNLPDGIYYFNATANDSAGHTNSTETRMIILDTEAPKIDFVPPTTETGNYSQNYIVANVSSICLCPNETTVYLYNSTGLVNSTSNITNVFVNFTNLPDETYYLNATADDAFGNTNSTETRTIILHSEGPNVEIVYPVGQTLDEDTPVPISLNISDPDGIDTLYADITFPNTTSIRTYDFETGLPSDDFEADTEGINWVHKNETVAGQTCYTDINDTVPGKMFIEVDAAGIFTEVQCAFNSLKKVEGDYDLNLTFNLTYLDEDTFFTLRSAGSDILSASGPRAYIVIGNIAGQNEYRFGFSNASGETYVTTVPTNDTYGKLRIKRFNFSTGTPVFNLYYWNNSGNDWINVDGNISIPTSSGAQYIQIKPSASGSTFGKMNMTVDDFLISGDNYTFAIFNQTDASGVYNVTVFANDSYGNINNTETTWFNITPINDFPSRPYLNEPDPGEVVIGIFNVTWGQVTDEENDDLRFNLTLLNSDGSDNSTVVSDYGDINTTLYTWNTTTFPDGIYSLRITVYEINTPENNTVSETLGGNFTHFVLDNIPPSVEIIYPLNDSINQNTDVPIVVNANDGSGISFVSANITLPNSTMIQTANFEYPLQSEEFTNLSTIGTNWEFRTDSLASGHTCAQDIDPSPGIIDLSISGASVSGNTTCGISSLKKLEGNFDANLTFNVTLIGDDSVFEFKINDEKELSSGGVGVSVSLNQTAGQKYYRFAYFNSSGTTITQIATDDSLGKMRIKRSNITAGGLPIFDAYYYNNSNNSWIHVLDSIPLNESDRIQYAHIFLVSIESTLSPIDVVVDNFLVSEDNHSFIVFNQTSEIGQYNVTIFANDSAGKINATESTTFHIVSSNTAPASPIITQPVSGDILSGLTNITWNPIVDSQNDSLQFNITLLNTDNSSNATIVSNYGDSSSTYYEWNTTDYPDDTYKLEVVVFENDSLENFSTSSGSFIGSFTVDNNVPSLEIISPMNITYNTSIILVNISSDGDNVWYNYDGTNYTYSLATNITLGNDNYTLYAWANDSAGNLNYTNVSFEVNSNFTMLITLVTPPNNAVDPDGTVIFNCSVTGTEALSKLDLYINGSLNQTTNVSGTTNASQWAVPLANDLYNWSCKSYDSLNNSATGSTRNIIVNTAANPTYNQTVFSGDTTNWSNEVDITNVCNSILDDPSTNKIVWDGCVNASGANFDANVIFSENNITIFSANLNSSFNSSATLTFRNLVWNYTPVIYLDGVECPTSVCSNVSYNISSGIAIVNVTHFTSYITVGASQMEIWDETDSGMPHASQTKYANQTVKFFANYSKKSDSTPYTSATCIINFSDGGGTMTYNATTTYYDYNRTFVTNGTFLYNVTCNQSEAQLITANDSVLINYTEAPGVQFVFPTTSAGGHNQDYIVANVTTLDGNLDTLAVYLYNSTDLINSTFSNNTSLFVNFTGLSDGTYYLNATANDSVGNINYSETRTIVLDSVIPNIEIISPQNITYNTSTVLVNISSDGDYVWYGYSGTNYTYVSAVNISLSNGNYVLYAWANDSAGNLNSSNVSFEINSPSVISCGDGVKDVGDECDGSDFGGSSCGSFGYEAGSLTCSSSCVIDSSGCYNVGGCRTYWECNNWSSCVVGVQNRTCEKERRGCYVLEDKPIESRECVIGEVGGVPAGVGIGVNLDVFSEGVVSYYTGFAVFQPGSILTKLVFSNIIGRIPVMVNYMVYNEKGNLVYESERPVFVEEGSELLNELNDIKGEGNYVLVARVIYEGDIVEVRENFEVEYNSWIFYFILIILILGLLFIVFKRDWFRHIWRKFKRRRRVNYYRSESSFLSNRTRWKFARFWREIGYSIGDLRWKIANVWLYHRTKENRYRNFLADIFGNFAGANNSRVASLEPEPKRPKRIVVLMKYYWLRFLYKFRGLKDRRSFNVFRRLHERFVRRLEFRNRLKEERGVSGGFSRKLHIIAVKIEGWWWIFRFKVGNFWERALVFKKGAS